MKVAKSTETITDKKERRNAYMKEFRKKHPGYGYKYNKKYKETHPNARYEERKRYYNKTAFSENGYSRWSFDEIELVMKHEMTDSELSAKLGRSVAAIQHMRYRCIHGEKK